MNESPINRRAGESTVVPTGATTLAMSPEGRTYYPNVDSLGTPGMRMH